MGFVSRRSTTWWFVAIFATISLFVRATHYHPIFGLHNGPCSCDAPLGYCDTHESDTSNHRHIHACVGHHGAHKVAKNDRGSFAPGNPFPHNIDAEDDSPAVGRLDTSSNCLICQFFAQGQLLSAPPALCGLFIAPDGRVFSPRPVQSRVAPVAYGARAPPVVG